MEMVRIRVGFLLNISLGIPDCSRTNCNVACRK